jgi:uncharacterized protein (TIGR03437 family)
MPKFLWATVLALASTVLYGQQLPYPTSINPGFVYVGSGATNLSLGNYSYPTGLTALWNGSARPTSLDTSFGSSGTYKVALAASDLAVPQLATIAMVDGKSGAVIDTVYVPVGYNVTPTGVAFDSVRSRLYIATPAKPGDSRFPGNSVVAIDPASGQIGPSLQIGGTLGDLALSDDASALYVVVAGLSLVRRINPATMTAAGDFAVPAGASQSSSSALAANNLIAVMPGHPGTVVLQYTSVTGNTGTQLAIFDNGVQRPNAITPACCSSAGLLFSPDGKYFFQGGIMNTAPGSAYSTFRYSVGSTGIPKQTPVSAAGYGPAAISGGALYTSLANVIDYQTMTVTGNLGVGGPIAVDGAVQRAYLLYTPPPYDDGGSTPQIELVAFALPSLEPLGSQAVGCTAITSLNDSEKLIHFGGDGFVLPSNLGLLIFHTPLAGPGPATSAAAVVNAASQQGGVIAPGEILTLYGTVLGPASPQAAVSQNGVFPSWLGNVQVWFGSLPGTLLMVYQGQINVVAPFELRPGSTVNAQVWYFGLPSAQIALPVVAAAPALFTRDGSGSGLVAVINQDGSVNTPAPAGSVVMLYGTGGGATANAVDGAMARGAYLLSATAHVSIAGQDAPVSYAGAAPGLVNGVFQLNVLVPADVPSGAAAITVTINGQSSPKGATLAIR